MRDSYYEILHSARPEWVAKRYIIDIYFRVSGLEATASLDPATFLEFKAGVRQLYRIMRVKMWRFRSKLGISEEKMKRYDSYLLPKQFRRLKFEEVVEWFNDIQVALERLGYTRFESSQSIEELVRMSREG